ncbi:MAG: LacI family DNA-binding transcriptional regulator [Gemmobacter sp.]|nr:LacI family DNA-binding transcriptional regulator [Gemmobacter sp.]
MNKPTLLDVARAAGVSYATADRVLNARGGVAEKSIQRVQRAIEDLGYERDLHAANLSRRRTYAFRFLVPQGDHAFFRELRHSLEAERAPRRSNRISIFVQEIPALDPEALADALDRIQVSDCDCLAVVATDAPRVTQAITRLTAQGMPVITLVGDAAPDARAAYVGIDNVMAGRTAGRLIRLAHTGRTGRILPVVGALTARDHRDRLDGVREVLGEPGGSLDLMAPVAVQDRADRMRVEVGQALRAAPDITGIYSIGAGNRALIEIMAQLPGQRPFVVLHELTPVSRDGLERGLIDAVIDQMPAREIAVALDVMKALADGRDLATAARDITPTIYLRDNLPVPGRQGDTT